jgi:hypothetical protein
VVLYFASDETGRWNTRVDHEGEQFAQYSDDLKDFDEYQVVRIGRILTRLYGEPV